MLVIVGVSCNLSLKNQSIDEFVDDFRPLTSPNLESAKVHGQP